MSSAEVRPCVVLDIDGVLADVRHRLRFVATQPKDWRSFFAAASNDEVLEAGADFARAAAASFEIVYLTGRPERTREDTVAWLKKHGLPAGQLIMRRNGDRQPAVLTKTQALQALAKHRRVRLVVDDDPSVVRALTAAGFSAWLTEWMPREPTLRDAQEREGRT